MRKKSTIVKASVLVVLLLWSMIVFIDFLKIRKNEMPIFCLKKVVNKYDDGSTFVCTGVGYKAIVYSRKCRYAQEFGPIFLSERQCDTNETKQ